VNGVVVIAKDGIDPLLKVEGVEATLVLTGEGGLGGNMPSVVVAKMGVCGLSDEVETFSSIVACKTI
jgi:hypothetical protein